MARAGSLLCALVAATAVVAASAQGYGYGSYGSYGPVPAPGGPLYYSPSPAVPLAAPATAPNGAPAACTVSFNFTSHSDNTYKCGTGTCKVVQVAVTNLQPYAIPYGWGMTLTSSTWTDPIYSVNTWWNCANLTLSSGTVSLTSNAEWQRLAANSGNTVGYGYIMEGSGPDDSLFTAESATLNGRTCAIV